ncbi:MAG: hypothetical protein ACYC0Y_28910 [Pirellulales bacterium]
MRWIWDTAAAARLTGKKNQARAGRRARLEPLEDRRLLSLVGVPPLGGLEWIAASTDEPGAAGTPTEIAFSGEAGILTAAPAAPDLLDISDTGVSKTDNLTNLDNSAPDKILQFSVANTIAGATVTVYADGTAIGSALADGATTTITTNGNVDLVDGVRSITARQTSPGEEESSDSAALGVTVDTVGPVVNPVRIGAFHDNGPAWGVAVSGTFAYVAEQEAGLVIFDITNPAAPVRVGRYATSGFASAVTISGTLAFVADGSTGLLILDVANPAAPQLVGACNTSGLGDVAVVGTVAYVAGGLGGLVIVDITNPTAPAQVGFFRTGGVVQDVAVCGTVAYLASDSLGLVILDVTNPAAPEPLSILDTGGSAAGLIVAGTRAYGPFQ